MARTVLPIAGAIIGAFYGNPYAGYAIGAAIAGVVDPINTKGPRIGETGAQTSQEGAPRAIVYGTCQVTGNVIASGPLIKRDVKESQGKGGGTTSTEHAYRTYAVRVCEGPIDAVLRIWQDDKLVFDIRPSTTMLQESEKWKSNKVFYYGTETQLPDASLQMIFGVDETPAHRGSAYIVAIEDDLTDRRGSIPQYRFEVASNSGSEPWDYSWTQHPLPGLLSSSGVAIAAAPNGEMAVVTYTREIYISSDGESWTQVVGSEPSGHTLIYSIDLDKWTAPTGNLGTPSMHYRQGMVPWTSFTPTENYPAQANDFPYMSGVWAGDRFVAVRSPPGTELIYSSDGVNWANGYAGPNGWKGLAYANTIGASGRLVATNGSEAGYSDDKGESWNIVATPGSGLGQVVWAAQLSIFVAIGVTPIWSEDGLLWNAGSWDGTVSGGTCLAWSPELGVFVSPGGDGGQYFAVSTDGKTWVSSDAGAAFAPTERPQSVVWNATLGKFFFVSGQSVFSSNTARASGVPVPLSDIVDDIHTRCNFPAGKADTSELTDMVSGLVLAGDYTGADAINTLRSLYLFDAADQDKSIVYPKRGKPVVATITEDDIVEAQESSKREQAIEYPKKLHLSYQNAVGGYAVAKATSARSSPDVRVVGEVSTSVPVVLNPDQAAQTAAIMHKIAWAEAEGERKLSLPLSWVRYIASDCFGVALRGRVTRERLDELNTADGVIEYTMRRDRQGAYTSDVTGIPIPPPTAPPSTIVGEAVLAVLDISPRTESEDDLNLLYAVTGGLPAWTGATVQRSLDGGANFSSVVDIDRGQVLGTLVNALSDASEFFTDTTNVLRVQLYRDTQTIESITDVQFLSEGGAFAVQRPDSSWEVMQFRDADEVSSGVFDLSYLHRGQLNSGTTAHLAGSLFVMLSDAVKVPAQSAWIGADLTHRAVSYTESPETADEQTQTYVGRSQLEWPIAYLTLARDGAGNVSGTWTPRHRLGTEDSPVASGNFRGYRVTLDDGVLAAVTFDTTAQSFTYDASALGTPLTVSVSALNRITGAGPSTSGAI